MSDNRVFVDAAVYAEPADADADYDTLLDLHSADLVGSYDVALSKDDEGKVHVTKHEKPTEHGAWTGAAVGAHLSGCHLPPSIIGAAVVGAAAGGGIGHAPAACLAATPRSSASTSTRARPR